MWHLDVTSNKDGFQQDGRYFYRATGYGIRVFVIDTGVNIHHETFNGRVQIFDTSFHDQPSLVCPNCLAGQDCHGHGTHVAGIIGSTIFGVAKDVTIVSYPVMNCKGQGDTLTILNSLKKLIKLPDISGSIISMSLGGGYSYALNQACTFLVDMGVIVVAAAGNEGVDAFYTSPASASKVITVGSHSKSGIKSRYYLFMVLLIKYSFSNYGEVVDIYAPGEQIVSAYKPRNDSYTTLQGIFDLTQEFNL